jgi:hypothetical protein
MNDLESELEDLESEVEEAREAIDDCDDPSNPSDELLEDLEDTELSLKDFDHDRLKELKSFFEYNSKDDVFIEERDLGEYAEECLKDQGVDIPFWVHVDWEETGKTLSMDLDSTEWEGSTWYKL